MLWLGALLAWAEAWMLTIAVRSFAGLSTEGKTDYYQRKRLVINSKNKYETKKHRFVVRFSNKYVLCQIIEAEFDHDVVVSQASSRELPRYGLSVGLKNYAAAYATGLLAARRVLAKLGLSEAYKGAEEVSGDVYQPEEEGERRPFKCLLDVGTKATTTGSRIFGALKGASDGGLYIPQSNKRFPGFNREEKTFDADFHKKMIFGGHVGEYMSSLAEEDEEAFNAHFSKYVEAEVEADGLEDLYTKVHEAIRADPSPAAKKPAVEDKSHAKPKRRNLKERQNRVAQKKAWRLSKLNAAQPAGGDDDEDEEDDE